MTKNTNKAADLWVGCAMMVVSIIFFVSAWKMPDSPRGIGPGDYPMFVCVLLFILGLVQALRVLVTEKGIPGIDWQGVNKRFLLRAFIMFAATFLYYFLMRIIGFPITTMVYLFGSMMFFGYKNKIKAAIISVVFTLFVYLLFVRVFQVLLPSGFLI